MRKSKEEETIGQRILAAVLSYQLGISMKRARDLYIAGKEISPTWDAVGAQLLEVAGPEIPGGGSVAPINRESPEPS